MEIHVTRKDGLVLVFERKTSDGDSVWDKHFVSWEDLDRMGAARKNLQDAIARNKASQPPR